jgi:hypothetical protein
MVHALDEIRRVLVEEGVLIDLRPLGNRWRVEVFSARETRLTGTMTDLPAGLEDDNAANQAMAEGERQGRFLREKEELFPIHYIWDTPSEMEEWIDTEWEGFVGLGDETRRATRSAWALGDADSRVRVEVKVLITRWRKL